MSVLNQSTKQKSPSELLPRGIHVLRTGIEPHMIISNLRYLQADLQAVKDGFCILCFIQGYNDKA